VGPEHVAAVLGCAGTFSTWRSDASSACKTEDGRCSEGSSAEAEHSFRCGT
jgi:hypothetical protein